MIDHKVRICVIDSGLNNDLYHEYTTNGVSIVTENGTFHVVNDQYHDEIGHGTAVVDAISRARVPLEIYCVKVITQDMELDFDKFCYALEYVADKIDCDILNISAGTTVVEDYSRLEAIISKLIQRQTTIVSAYDNSGVISYPAVMDEVVGVDVDSLISEWKICEGTAIDITVPDKYYRLKWLNPRNIIIKGSSFACGEVCAYIAEIIHGTGRMPKKAILNVLSESIKCKVSRTEVVKPSWIKGREFVKQIKEAVILPFNKEIHALACNEDLLPFRVKDYYDIKYSKNIGKEIKSILPHSNNNKQIRNSNEIDWASSFDTVICGHCSDITKLSSYDLLSEITIKCKKYNKKLYCFDNNDSNQDTIFFPSIKTVDVPKHRNNKLRYFSTPIISILGTSSKQGKYSLQLLLYRKFLESGYRVSSIATEPNGYLFGFDGVYPMGYNSTIFVDRADAVTALNEMIWDATKDGSDLLLMAGQSGSIPYDNGNLARYTFNQHDFICTLNSDCIVLCVNLHDDISYIQKTINYIESLSAGAVIAIVVYPVVLSINKLGYQLNKRLVDMDSFNSFRNQLQNSFRIPIYLLGKNDDIEDLVVNCIDYLSEETRCI